MIYKNHNNPPYHVIELEEFEYQYFREFMKAAVRDTDKKFIDICSMSSKDPRANQRAILSMAVGFDLNMQQGLLDKLRREGEGPISLEPESLTAHVNKKKETKDD